MIFLPPKLFFTKRLFIKFMNLWVTSEYTAEYTVWISLQPSNHPSIHPSIYHSKLNHKKAITLWKIIYAIYKIEQVQYREYGHCIDLLVQPTTLKAKIMRDLLLRLTMHYHLTNQCPSTHKMYLWNHTTFFALLTTTFEWVLRLPYVCHHIHYHFFLFQSFATFCCNNYPQILCRI